MSFSDEKTVHMTEDELLDSLDYEHMDSRQKERIDRIIVVNKMLLYKTTEEVAKELGVDIRTIQRDAHFISKFIGGRWIDNLAHHGYGKMTMDFTARNEESLRKLYIKKEHFEEATDPLNVEIYLKIQAEIDKIEIMLVEMTGAGPALQSMKKAMREEKTNV